MTARVDIVVFGTGSFAGRIVCDLAATAGDEIRVAVAGRNLERLNWLTLAANARATIFQRPAQFLARAVDLTKPGDAEALLAELQPSVVVQAASSQPSSVISTQGNAWSRLVAEGGLSATTVFQAHLTSRVARAVASTLPSCRLINCCFPDVVNPILAAGGMRVDCGVGNVAILANAFAGALGLREPGRVKVLAPYQTITPFRRPAEGRSGPRARAWIDDDEVADVFAAFAGVKITAEPAIEISGASGVPLMLAMAHRGAWRGHVPGPNGLPGGYPVVFRDGVLALDLPSSIGRDEAVRWNAAFEEANGIAVGPDGRVRYAGILYERLRAASPGLAEGFAVADLEAAHEAMAALRQRLMAQPAA